MRGLQLPESGLELLQLRFQVLDVFFLAFAEGALGGAVLGSAALLDGGVC